MVVEEEFEILCLRIFIHLEANLKFSYEKISFEHYTSYWLEKLKKSPFSLLPNSFKIDSFFILYFLKDEIAEAENLFWSIVFIE